MLPLDNVPATAAVANVTAVALDTTSAAAANVTAVATGVVPTTASIPVTSIFLLFIVL